MKLARLDEPRTTEPRSRGSHAALDAAPRRLWAAVAILAAIGLLLWGIGLATATPEAGVAALWLFGAVAIAVALLLPLPQALVSPLFMGLLGWLVDMLPFVVLAGWTAVVARWAFKLLQERRLPRVGRWMWLVTGLAGWTVLGIASVSSVDLKHFALLVGIQFLISGVLLAAADSLRTPEDRLVVVSSLVLLIVVMSAGVLLDFAGAPVQQLQYEEVSDLVEEAYGLDAFPNNQEMIKYSLSSKGGAREFRARLDRFAEANPGLPVHDVFLPAFRAFENQLVIRFEGSARSFEDELRSLDVDLLYDNIGLTSANTVPRFRSFARNSLTYAGMCVVLFPLACFLAWSFTDRRRLLGLCGMAACLVGAGFALARGAWIAIAAGIVYLAVDGVVARRRKIMAVVAYLLAALAVTGFFLARYSVDPLNARAFAGGSVATRASVYQDTVESLNGVQVLVGFGTERPRTESGTTHALGRYIPSAGTHSTYLNYLFRTGAPGALAIIAIYLIAALHGRAAARELQGRERLLATILTATIVSAAVHAVILSLYVEPLYTLTVSVVIGLTMSIGMKLRSSVIPWRRASNRT